MTFPTPEAALAELEALSDPARAARMAERPASGLRPLGVAGADIDALAGRWRQAGKAAGADEIAGRAALARGLWDSGVFEARIAAAKLLIQARIRDDAPVWDLVRGWVGACDCETIADHVAAAGSRRLSAAPERLDAVEAWVAAEDPWTRRAAMTFTLPWARDRHPGAQDLARRERVLDWAAALAADRDGRVQMAVGRWLRTLSARDPQRVRAFDAAHGAGMKPFARREALRALPAG